MLDHLTADRTPGIPPAADTWIVTAKSGTNPTISITLSNVSTAGQLSVAVAKLLTLLDALANFNTGIVIDATKLPL